MKHFLSSISFFLLNSARPHLLRYPRSSNGVPIFLSSIASISQLFFVSVEQRVPLLAFRGAVKN
jgi:hypothetical protein